ncbi:hypothetical protein TSTA_101760 [Talaromyces stipitatus ATCC 10500]|uniref:Methyltransferase domain-containing protein n=1 Tax=Talaromyces stipitatus (strain ATCC 10500 / CBS 375.48 / QM 6759 / NRRL 1006) TaxID=441959 RepID=B8MMZ1_TALSN|nr:uncharacterized protein TSTA_101760 [Talaromyces stipitatus ATCC 10500]EED13940.1 hypothetical protein TSTA_101760 [Talaromyces stipitatus ATCC 10500]
MATAPTASTEEVYLFNRNDFERKRLNKQHELLVSLCNGNLLHPHIPKAAIGRLADIGTGSGIWLDDVAEKLEPDLEATSSLTEREYAGFDISAAHFPANPRPDTCYIVHDILEPFPNQFHNFYDVVNVRLMVLALKKYDIRVAAMNVAALLSKFYAIKPRPYSPSSLWDRRVAGALIYPSDSIFLEEPGGFFQWEEIETRDLSFNPPSETTTKRPDSQILRPYAIEQAFKELGLVDVIVEDYNSINRLDLINHVREWTKAGAKAALYYALLRGHTVKNEEEAWSASAGLWEAYAAGIDGGIVPSLPLKMILGRKVSVGSAS